MDPGLFIHDRALYEAQHLNGVDTPQDYDIRTPQNSIVLANSGVVVRTSSSLRVNSKGRIYSSGEGFSEADWANFILLYDRLLHQNGGKCTVRQLADAARISVGTAAKAIHFFNKGSITLAPRGHGRRGMGSLTGFDEDDHVFVLYSLYRENPRRPVDSYVYELSRGRNRHVSRNFISQWFYLCRFYTKHTNQRTK